MITLRKHQVHSFFSKHLREVNRVIELVEHTWLTQLHLEHYACGAFGQFRLRIKPKRHPGCWNGRPFPKRHQSAKVEIATIHSPREATKWR